MTSTLEMRRLADNAWLSDQGQMGRDIARALRDAADQIEEMENVLIFYYEDIPTIKKQRRQKRHG